MIFLVKGRQNIVTPVVELNFIVPIEHQSSGKNSVFSFLFTHNKDGTIGKFCEKYNYPKPEQKIYRIPNSTLLLPSNPIQLEKKMLKVSAYWQISVQDLDRKKVSARHLFFSHNDDDDEEHTIVVDLPVNYKFTHDVDVWFPEDKLKQFNPTLKCISTSEMYINVIYWLENTLEGKLFLHFVSTCGSYHGLLTSSINITPKPGDLQLYHEEKKKLKNESKEFVTNILHCQCIELCNIAIDKTYNCVKSIGRQMDEVPDNFIVTVPINHLTMQTKIEWVLRITPCACCLNTEAKSINTFIFKVQEAVSKGCTWVQSSEIVKEISKMYVEETIMIDVEEDPYKHVLIPIIALMDKTEK